MLYLKELGVRCEDEDIFGFTAYSLALFQKNLEIAMLLANLKKEEIINDPRWGNAPPDFSHYALASNMISYLKKKYENIDDTRIKFYVVEQDGVCNGWSFQAALAASENDELVEKHYKVSAIFSRWDNTVESLIKTPPAYATEYKTLDEMFKEFTQEILYLYQQSVFSSGLSSTDRVKQLELVSDKRKLLALADIALPDLTFSEQLQILTTYQNLSDDMIIDVHSSGHNVSYYQEKQDIISFFDPEIRYRLAKFSSYQKPLEIAVSKAAGGFSSFSYYHAHPTSEMRHIIEKAEVITQDLIKKFIIDNPQRVLKIKEILHTCAVHGSQFFLEALLKNVIIKKLITPEMLISCAEKAVSNSRLNYQIFPILFRNGLNVTQLKSLNIFLQSDFLKAAISYTDQELYDTIKPLMIQSMSEYSNVYRKELPEDLKYHFLSYLKFKSPSLVTSTSDVQSSQAPSNMSTLSNKKKF